MRITTSRRLGIGALHFFHSLLNHHIRSIEVSIADFNSFAHLLQSFLFKYRDIDSLSILSQDSVSFDNVPEAYRRTLRPYHPSWLSNQRFRRLSF